MLVLLHLVYIHIPSGKTFIYLYLGSQSYVVHQLTKYEVQPS